MQRSCGRRKLCGVRGGWGRVEKLCGGEAEPPTEVEGGGKMLGIMHMIIYVTVTFKHSICTGWFCMLT